MVDRNNVHADLERQIRDTYGPLVLATKIPRNIKIEESHARFESITTYAPKSVGATAYMALTEELLAHAADRTEDGNAAAEGHPRAHGAA
jgi:chromosome partitioning protein